MQLYLFQLELLYAALDTACRCQQAHMWRLIQYFENNRSKTTPNQATWNGEEGLLFEATEAEVRRLMKEVKRIHGIEPEVAPLAELNGGSGRGGYGGQGNKGGRGGGGGRSAYQPYPMNGYQALFVPQYPALPMYPQQHQQYNGMPGALHGGHGRGRF
ncbi:hypothetical protein Vretifemale_15847 [Volvox reticuliferus]|uniref:Uncharacterized protein n=1 Tax=Volvox reticuliferus TaxID=1737510 RepID=A0A8J4CUG3_9CHLO|nr:hypothetical protein Vretifemale_15847 [Volvox reticuliferus]